MRPPSLSSLLLASTLLAGCGRIDFVERPPNDGSTDADANMADAPWPTLNGRWTWISGSNVLEQQPIYGTRGVASPTNRPGARDNGGSWVHANALWMFGGVGLSGAGYGQLGDMWRFDLTSREWTWVSGVDTPDSMSVYGSLGVPATTNRPGGRNDQVYWRGDGDQMFMYGGSHPPGEWSDVWRYDTDTNEWAWLAGSATDEQAVHGTRGVPTATTTPGARAGLGAMWRIGNDLYLLGGNGTDQTATTGDFVDLWRFSLTTRQWTWVSGPTTVDLSPQYGIKGVPDPANFPSDGNCPFIVGGDLWWVDSKSNVSRYSIADDTWTWVRGPGDIEVGGMYGSRGATSVDNFPGARSAVTCWQDLRGNLWMFGGYGYDRNSTLGYLNDLWVWQPALEQWTWVAGSNVIDENARFGTLGVPDDANTPGAQYNGNPWVTDDGALWLFGGDYSRIDDVLGRGSALWRFSAD